MNLRLPVLSAVAVVLVSATSFAELRLDLVESSNMPAGTPAFVGVPVQLSVMLSGLPADARLTSLSSTVVFSVDAAVAGGPQPGLIIPDPLANAFDFVSFSDAGIVDATFLTFHTQPEYQITNDGAFYTFAFTPVATGPATLQFDFVAAFLIDSAAPELPTPVEIVAGPALRLDVVEVPEPGTLAIASGAFMLLARRRRPLS